MRVEACSKIEINSNNTNAGNAMECDAHKLLCYTSHDARPAMTGFFLL